MKRVFITLFCLSVSAAAVKAQDKAPLQPQANPTPASQQAAPEVKKTKTGVFKFKEENNTHDYGQVIEGQPAEYEFQFKNVGKDTIRISRAQGSCGCTVPTWPDKPIPPKGRGVIKVAYSTQGRQGAISKEVTIFSDANEPTTVLHIRGTVLPAPKPADAPQAPATH